MGVEHQEEEADPFDGLEIQIKPLFELDLGSNGGLLRPKSWDELIAWLKAEVDFWSWLNSPNNGGHVAIVVTLITQVAQALSAAQSTKRQPDELSKHQALQECETLINKVFVKSEFPHSSTKLALQIKAYSDQEGSDSGSWYCAAFFPSNRQIAPTLFAQWKGFIQGINDRFSEQSFPSNGLAAAASAYEMLNSRINLWHEQSVTEINTVIERLDNVSKRIDQLHRDQRKNYEVDCDSRVQKFNELTTEHASDMAQIRKTFKDEISLRAPVDYWTKKQVVHTWITGIFGVLSFAGIAAVAWIGSTQLKTVLAVVAPDQKPDPLSIAALILIGGFSLWGIRLLVRIFLSNLHLMTDAQERVVMVQTYLALLEGKSVDPADRSYVLQSLFRPTADGIVKDESLPSTIFEMLTRSNSKS